MSLERFRLNVLTRGGDDERAVPAEHMEISLPVDVAESPVRNQPSAVKAAAVLSGKR